MVRLLNTEESGKCLGSVRTRVRIALENKAVQDMALHIQLEELNEMKLLKEICFNTV